MKKGKVFLLGAGPGDEGLLTVKAKKIIQLADVVIYDYLVNKKILAYANNTAEIIYAGKKGSDHTIPQQEINRLIIDKSIEGKTVARLKGGDPFIFGRGGEEANALSKNGVEFEIVSGVTSAIAVPAYAGIPLTHREYNSTVTFITGHENPQKEKSKVAWEQIAPGTGTLVFIMGVKKLPEIVKKLIENNRPSDTPIAIIQWGTTAEQKTVTGTLTSIMDIAKAESIKPPAVIVVGNVVKLREKLSWFEIKPLFGKRIVITRPEAQSKSFIKLLENNGAAPFLFPTIKTVDPDSWDDLDTSIKKIETYDWLLFTSVNGVRYFFKRLEFNGKDVRELKGIKICTIGPKTADEVKKRYIKVDIIPDEYKAESVIEAFKNEEIKGKKILLPRASVAREILPEELKRMGAEIDVIHVYKTIQPVEKKDILKQMLANREVDVITFTSSSTVTNFAGMFTKDELSNLMEGVCIASIGPITAKTAENAGLVSNIEPEKYTIESLTDAMVDYFRS